MLRENSHNLTAIHILLELGIIIGGILGAGLVVDQPVTPEARGMILGLAISTGSLYFIAGLQGSFYDSKRTESIRPETWAILRAGTTCLATNVFAFLAMGRVQFAPAFLVWAWITMVGGPILLRLAIRVILRFIRRKGFNVRRVLVVGNNARTTQLIRAVNNNHHYGLSVVGFIDSDNPISEDPPDPDVVYMGKVEDLPRVVEKTQIDKVICCLPMRSGYAATQEVLRLCEEIGTPVMILSTIFTTNIAKKSIRWLGELPLICYSSGPTDGAAMATKRLVDLVGSFLLLILFSPLMIGIALVIKLTSKGPVLFSQERSGLHAKPFNMLKFRSMVQNAEQLKEKLRGQNEVDGPVFKMKNDPRITKIGSFLRKTSLDELPQLFNVLRGEMSLVGPRPPIPAEVSDYEWWQRRRLSMRPGLTCIWQVSGRNAIRFERWMEMDLEYIDNWSLGLDFRLLALTAKTVLRPTGV